MKLAVRIFALAAALVVALPVPMASAKPVDQPTTDGWTLCYFLPIFCAR